MDLVCWLLRRFIEMERAIAAQIKCINAVSLQLKPIYSNV